ncbi:glycoside hydrolase family 20 protein [Spirosoma litoris]
MLTRLLFIAAFSLRLLFASGQSTDRYTIIPRPAQLEPRAGEFLVSQHTTVMVPFAQADLKAIAESFVNQIKLSSGMSLSLRTLDKTPVSSANAGANLIQFLPLRDTTMGDEGYHLDITPQFVTIQAASPKGFFYAVQTLYQLLPPAVLGKDHGAGGMGSLVVPAPRSTLHALPIPACRIQDKPRYVYRGMNLDVSRHFFSVAFIKKYLDLMALHKFNNFHWHLTDDQGWRIEIKKYPKLTQIGSRRRETLVGHYDDFDPQVFDGKPYNEFYTQDEIREVIRYAATKYINVIPEIELPGHALAALASYPELACTTGPYQVATKWGVFDDVFCPTEKTFTFLQDVLTEVIELFPSKYIHIGGDECPKTVWHRSAFCQQLMKRLKLKNENQLQSYIITRIDKFVTAKGRRIIGWDEILQGGLSPNATVMSWRGINGGIQAAKLHHDVIMTPGQFCYLNFYQGDFSQEPVAFGGSLPIDKVYSYDPTPAGLLPTEAKYILGAQGNVWTEYIATPGQAEYMIWPRAAAMAEVVWTPLAQKDYNDFSRRLPTHFERLSHLNVNYARTFYDAQFSAKPTSEGHVEVTLSPNILSPDIRYTLDGSIPSGESPRYEKPILLTRSATVRTATFQNGKPLSQLAKLEKEYLVSKATGKSYTLLNAPTSGRPDPNYNLTDGTTGGIGGYEISGVVAFRNDLNAVIDLGKLEPIESIRIGFLKYTAKNICLPKQVEISVSEDGKVFKPALTARTNAAESGKRAIVRLPFDFTTTHARYIRIIARNVGKVPVGLRYPGKAAQLGIDEIEVR